MSVYIQFLRLSYYTYFYQITWSSSLNNTFLQLPGAPTPQQHIWLESRIPDDTTAEFGNALDLWWYETDGQEKCNGLDCCSQANPVRWSKI